MNVLQTFTEATLGYPVAWGDTAAWVQAVGSVVAIIAAIWIDHGAARRQRQALDRAEADRREAEANLGLAILGQASFSMRYTEAALEGIRISSPIPDAVQYDRWNLVVNDHARAAEQLQSRITDGPLLITLIVWIRAARERIPGGHYATVMADCLAAMRSAMPKLEKRVQDLVDLTDLDAKTVAEGSPDNFRPAGRLS